MDVIRSHRRPPVEVALPAADGSHSEPTVVDYGFVGDVDKVNADALATLLDAGITPALAPLTHDGRGNILNTNADTIAATAAKALAARYDVTLIYTFEKAGVLRDPDDDSSVIPTITRSDFQRLCRRRHYRRRNDSQGRECPLCRRRGSGPRHNHQG